MFRGEGDESSINPPGRAETCAGGGKLSGLATAIRVVSLSLVMFQTMKSVAKLNGP